MLPEPYPITKESVREVVEQGDVPAGDVCSGDIADVCAELGNE